MRTGNVPKREAQFMEKGQKPQRIQTFKRTHLLLHRVVGWKFILTEERRRNRRMKMTDLLTSSLFSASPSYMQWKNHSLVNPDETAEWYPGSALASLSLTGTSNMSAVTQTGNNRLDIPQFQLRLSDFQSLCWVFVFLFSLRQNLWLFWVHSVLVDI